MQISVEQAARVAGAQEHRRHEPLFEERPVGALLTAERRRLRSRYRTIDPDIAFLSRHGVPQGILACATQLAACRGTEARQELLSAGLGRNLYWSALAADLRLAFVANLRGATLVAHRPDQPAEVVRHAVSVIAVVGGRQTLVVGPGAKEVALLRQRLACSPALAGRIAIAPPEAIRAFLVSHRHSALSELATNRLAATLPGLSARHLNLRGEPRGVVLLLAAIVGLALLAPATTFWAVGLLCSLFFVNCSYWKGAAAFRRSRALRLEPVPAEQLPTYTVLVPLFREAAVVPALIASLAALDYPVSKLQVLLLLESDDDETRAAVIKHAAGAPFEVITKPSGGPRTKPNALTYALPFARGDLVVVFDAEDRPEPDQLRKAAAAFREHPRLGCVQARLAPDNRGSWFARMFTLEYAANFEILLPALSYWRLPVPLGGTSNHFPRGVLERVGAWDPYNVTEDAELGVRLSRFGYQTATIVSRTHEEAPVSFRQWLPQRRRWIKGWMQTVCLCLSGAGMPRKLRLPLRQRLALHGILTAGVLGLLLYPFSLVPVAFAWSAFVHADWPDTFFEWAMLAFFGNLAVTLAAAAVASLRGLRAAGALGLAPLILFLPAYWALMSLAAWQAAFQLWRDPARWEKTQHGVARDRRKPRPQALL